MCLFGNAIVEKHDSSLTSSCAFGEQNKVAIPTLSSTSREVCMKEAMAVTPARSTVLTTDIEKLQSAHKQFIMLNQESTRPRCCLPSSQNPFTK